MTLKDITNTIDAIMADNKKARNENNYIKLIENGFACLEYINKIINISIDAEREYRKYEATLLMELKEQGNKGKNGEAETRAKATEYYIEFRHCEQLLNLCYEMVNVAKKLADSLNDELRAMKRN